MSSLRLFQSCPRKFYHRYHNGIEGRQEPDERLQFGTAVHSALEHNANKPVADWRVAEAVKGLDADLGALVAGTVSAYGVHWQGTLKFQATELELNSELRNPRLRLTSIVDGLAETGSGALAVVDYKTTQSDIRPGSWFFEKLSLDLQVSTYIWAARQNGHPVEFALWDAIRKPAIKRRTEATPPEYYVKSGKWGAAGDLKPGTGIPAESSGDYARRVRDTLLADPSDYFQRGEVVQLDDELDKTMDDVEQVGEQVLHCWDHSAFPRNTSNCFAWGRKCEFLPICDGSALPTDETLYQLRKSR